MLIISPKSHQNFFWQSKHFILKLNFNWFWQNCVPFRSLLEILGNLRKTFLSKNKKFQSYMKSLVSPHADKFEKWRLFTPKCTVSKIYISSSYTFPIDLKNKNHCSELFFNQKSSLREFFVSSQQCEMTLRRSNLGL